MCASFICFIVWLFFHSMFFSFFSFTVLCVELFRFIVFIVAEIIGNITTIMLRMRNEIQTTHKKLHVIWRCCGVFTLDVVYVACQSLSELTGQNWKIFVSISWNWANRTVNSNPAMSDYLDFKFICHIRQSYNFKME